MTTTGGLVADRTRPSNLVTWAVGALLAAPVLILRYPPMGDLAFHESLVALLRHFDDPTLLAPGLYVHNFGAPNQLFHLLAWTLSLVLPTDTACKLVVALSVGATPPSAAWVARHFGKSPWGALLVAPLTLGFAFRWGLVGNVVALPLLLLSLPALDRFAARPTGRGLAICVGWTVCLYLAHESALVVALVACAIFSLRRDLRLRGAAVRLVPLATGLGLAAYYTARSRHLKAPSILSVPDTFGPNPLRRIADVPGVLFGVLEAPVLYGMFAVYVVAFLPLVAARVGSGGDGAPGGGLHSRVERRRLELLTAACACAFLAMPLAFGGSTLLYQRFLPVTFALLALVVSPPASVAVRPIAPVLGVCASLAMLFVSIPALGDADRRFRELDALLPLIERNSAVAQLDLTPHSPGVVAPIPGAAARSLAERGGRLLFSFTDAPTSPVVMARSHQWNEPVLRLTYDPFAFSPPHDLRFFRYALVRLAPEASRFGPIIVSLMAPEARLAGDSGEWLLFESTLEVAPVTSGDPPRGPPAGPTLRTRIDALARNAGQ